MVGMKKSQSETLEDDLALSLGPSLRPTPISSQPTSNAGKPTSGRDSPAKRKHRGSDTEAEGLAGGRGGRTGDFIPLAAQKHPWQPRSENPLSPSKRHSDDMQARSSHQQTEALLLSSLAGQAEECTGGNPASGKEVGVPEPVLKKLRRADKDPGELRSTAWQAMLDTGGMPLAFGRHDEDGRQTCPGGKEWQARSSAGDGDETTGDNGHQLELRLKAAAEAGGSDKMKLDLLLPGILAAGTDPQDSMGPSSPITGLSLPSLPGRMTSAAHAEAQKAGSFHEASGSGLLASSSASAETPVELLQRLLSKTQSNASAIAAFGESHGGMNPAMLLTGWEGSSTVNPALLRLLAASGSGSGSTSYTAHPTAAAAAAPFPTAHPPPNPALHTLLTAASSGIIDPKGRLSPFSQPTQPGPLQRPQAGLRKAHSDQVDLHCTTSIGAHLAAADGRGGAVGGKGFGGPRLLVSKSGEMHPRPPSPLTLSPQRSSEAEAHAAGVAAGVVSDGAAVPPGDAYALSREIRRQRQLLLQEQQGEQGGGSSMQGQSDKYLHHQQQMLLGQGLDQQQLLLLLLHQQQQQQHQQHHHQQQQQQRQRLALLAQLSQASSQSLSQSFSSNQSSLAAALMSSRKSPEGSGAFLSTSAAGGGAAAGGGGSGIGGGMITLGLMAGQGPTPPVSSTLAGASNVSAGPSGTRQITPNAPGSASGTSTSPFPSSSPSATNSSLPASFNPPALAPPSSSTWADLARQLSLAAGGAGGGALDGKGAADVTAVSPRPRPPTGTTGGGAGGGAGGGSRALGSNSGGHSNTGATAASSYASADASDHAAIVQLQHVSDEGGGLFSSKQRNPLQFPKSGSDDAVLGRGGRRGRMGISPIQAVRPSLKHLVTTLSLSPRLADGGDIMVAAAAAADRSAQAGSVAVARASEGQLRTSLQNVGATGAGSSAPSIGAMVAGLMKSPSSRPPASVPGSPIHKHFINLPGAAPQVTQGGEEEEEDPPSRVQRRNTAPITRRSTSPIIGLQVDDGGNHPYEHLLLGGNKNPFNPAGIQPGSSLLLSQASSAAEQVRRGEEVSFRFPPRQPPTKVSPRSSGPSSGGDDVSLTRRARASDGTVAPKSRREASGPVPASTSGRAWVRSDKKRGDGGGSGGGGLSGDGGKDALSPPQRLPLSPRKTLPREGERAEGVGGRGGEEGGRGREREGKRKRKAEAVSSSSEGEEAEGGRGEGEDEWGREEGPREDLDELIKRIVSQQQQLQVGEGGGEEAQEGDEEEDKEEGADGKKSKGKMRLNEQQVRMLESIFEQYPRLTAKQKVAVADALGVRTRQVEVWFQNRRARTKVKRMERDLSKLQAKCDGLEEENARLKAQLQQQQQESKGVNSHAACGVCIPPTPTELSLPASRGHTRERGRRRGEGGGLPKGSKTG